MTAYVAEGVDRIPDESRTRRLAPAGRERHGDPVVDGGERYNDRKLGSPGAGKSRSGLAPSPV